MVDEWSNDQAELVSHGSDQLPRELVDAPPVEVDFAECFFFSQAPTAFAFWALSRFLQSPGVDPSAQALSETSLRAFAYM